MKPSEIPSCSRREALKRLAAVSAASAAPNILPASLFGANAPSKRVNVAMIGTGRQGINANLKTFLGMEDVRVVAVCDVDKQRLNFARGLVDAQYGNRDCKAFTDFREALEVDGLDAVMISTPDHWHTLPALTAMKKGLHVSCEKALTLFFREGRALADMAKKSGVVFRTDSECRSHAYMTKTADLAMNGYLGNIQRIEVGVPKELRSGAGDPAPAPVPEHLDYDMWLGPAPRKPYAVDRVHTNDKQGAPTGRPGWLRISDYTAGMICNWGAHLLDVANLINGTSHTGPVSVEGAGTFPEPGNLFDTIVAFDLQYRYANGVVLDYRIDNPYIKVIGDDGWIEAHWLSKGGLTAHDKKIFGTKFKDTDKRVATRSDKRDFIDAVLKGTPVMIDAETGHRLNSQGLIGLAAVRRGKRLEWDPAGERFTNDDAANAFLLKGTYRAPWKLEG